MQYFVIYLSIIAIAIFSIGVMTEKPVGAIAPESVNNCYDWEKLSKEDKVKTVILEVKHNKILVCK